MTVTTIGRFGGAQQHEPTTRPPAGPVLAGVTGAVVGSVVVAWLVANGLAVVGLALLLLAPAFVLFSRRPLLGVAFWVVTTQFIVEGAGGLRPLYWVSHRMAPAGVLLLVVLGGAFGLRRSLPRLGLVEFLMFGYLSASVFSILFASDTPRVSLLHLYDRVGVPMALYLLVRVLRPGVAALARAIPIAVFVVLAQTAIGLAAWVAPGVLPDAWLEREGTRTIGSLGHPNVFGVALILAGLLIFHAAQTLPMSPLRRLWYQIVFCVAFVMVFMTFGRAPWVAAVLVLLGLAVLYPGAIARLVLVLALVVALAVETGAFEEETTFAQERLTSSQADESALSRLPVVYASIAMFEAKPVAGWGYGNFDRFDREFQPSFTGLVIAEKDHASHNLYLTILAEQGFTGLLLYLGPAAWLLLRTLKSRRRLPATGFVSQRLLGVLWLATLAHVVVNNFSNMKVVYGLGLWWLTLGLIASLLDQASEELAS